MKHLLRLTLVLAAVAALSFVFFGCNVDGTHVGDNDGSDNDGRVIVDGWEYVDLDSDGTVQERSRGSDSEGSAESERHKMLSLTSDDIDGGIGINDPCPCCPDTLKNSMRAVTAGIGPGCCRWCFDYGKYMTSNSPMQIPSTDDTTGIMEIRIEYPWSGRAIVEGFCNIEISKATKGPVPTWFDITMDGETEKTRLNDPGKLEFELAASNEPGANASRVRLRREFRVETGTATFHLAAGVDGAEAGLIAGARALNVTYLPDIE